MHYIFMRSNLKEFDNQKAFSAFVGFTIKTLSTRSYAMAEAFEMHLLTQKVRNKRNVQNRRICLNRVTSTISYTYVPIYYITIYLSYVLIILFIFGILFEMF